MSSFILTSKQKQARRQAKRLAAKTPKTPKTVEGRNLLHSLTKAQPLLSGLEIRAARIGASRSIVPSLRRYKMWAKTQPKDEKAA